MYERTFRLDKVILHPQFRHNGPYSNDIAMIKVKSNSIGGISFNSHVKPICLPKYDEIYTPGTWCSVTGWGVQMRKFRLKLKLSTEYFNSAFFFYLTIQLMT